MIESAEVMTIKEVVNPATTKESVEVAVTVAQLPSTAPIEVRTASCGISFIKFCECTILLSY